VFSTFLTLYVVPAIYTYISSEAKTTEAKTNNDENKVAVA
jgi:hypothetical protein